MPQVQKLTDKRNKAIDSFLKEFTIEQFKKICETANASNFLVGKNDTGWKADFDFIMRTDKATSVLEGKYTNDEKKEGKSDKKQFQNYEQRQYSNLNGLYANKKEET